MNSQGHFEIATYLTYTGDKDLNGFIDDSTSQVIDIVNISSYTISNYHGETNYLILPSG